jgi:hypothetical protein
MTTEATPGALGSNAKLGLDPERYGLNGHSYDLWYDVVERMKAGTTTADQFAQIRRIMRAERERCAQIAEWAQRQPNDGKDFANGWCSAALQIAQAIRA